MRYEAKTCEHCSKRYQPADGSGPNTRFCGHRCAMLDYHSKRKKPVRRFGVPVRIKKVQGSRDKYSRDTSDQWWYLSGKSRLRAELKPCGWCGVDFLSYRNWGATETVYCSKSCGVKHSYSKLAPEDRQYRKARAFKGGRHFRSGYVMVLVPVDDPALAGTKHRYRPEHRVVMERVLGRRLEKHERVHHKNGVRDDNRPENLELWSIGHPAGQRMTEKPHCPTCTCFGGKH